MIRKFQIWLWGIVAELEYHLYPWKTSKPPQWAVERYNVDHGITDNFEDFYFRWIKGHKELIEKLQDEMLWVRKELHNLNEALNLLDARIDIFDGECGRSEDV